MRFIENISGVFSTFRTKNMHIYLVCCCQRTIATIDIPFRASITNRTCFIENMCGVFPHLERRIYTYILSVAASALAMIDIPFLSKYYKPRAFYRKHFWCFSTFRTSSETQGQLVGAGKSLKTGEKKFGRRKVKNEEKSPWGQCFNGPVPNGHASSGFWLVPENHCIFLPNHRAARLGAISRLLTR